MPKTKSHVSKGHAYFKHTGRYNEVKTSAKNGVVNDAPTAKKQKNLAPKGKKSAAAQTLKNAWAELGW
jgi:hypothetical protein